MMARVNTLSTFIFQLLIRKCHNKRDILWTKNEINNILYELNENIFILNIEQSEKDFQLYLA